MFALLLPLSFFWSWAAGAALCAAAMEHGKALAAGPTTAGDRAADAPDDCADCRWQAADSIVPERLSAKDAPAVVKNETSGAFRAPAGRSFDFVVDAAAHAPPRRPRAASLSFLCRRRI